MAKGVFKPPHKRINVLRYLKLTQSMLDLIHETCDEHDLSFSQFVRDAIDDSLVRYNKQSPKYRPSHNLGESWSRKSEQGDKWSFCLTAGTLCPANQERP